MIEIKDFKLDPSRDWSYSESCGCIVTFFANAEFKTSRMNTSDACEVHTDRAQEIEREYFIDRAKLSLWARQRPYCKEPRFLPYFGNHHKTFERSTFTRGGGVSFRDHLGKPLSARLWEDLTLRLRVSKISVFEYNAEEWTIGSYSQSATVYLDEKGMVSDVRFYP